MKLVLIIFPSKFVWKNLNISIWKPAGISLIQVITKQHYSTTGALLSHIAFLYATQEFVITLYWRRLGYRATKNQF